MVSSDPANRTQHAPNELHLFQGLEWGMRSRSGCALPARRPLPNKRKFTEEGEPEPTRAQHAQAQSVSASHHTPCLHAAARARSVRAEPSRGVAHSAPEAAATTRPAA